MQENNRINQAKELLSHITKHPLSLEEQCQGAIALTEILLQEAQAVQTPKEKAIQTELARMIKDPKGKVFTCEITDQCFRSLDSNRVVNQMNFLLDKYGLPRFFSKPKQWGLWSFRQCASLFPSLFINLLKKMLRKETSRVILPGEKEALSHHLQQRKKEGVRVNLNHLGEAILGEKEAKNRLNQYLEDLKNPEIEYVSIKISAIYSQINLLAWEETVKNLTERLTELYRAAQSHSYIRADGSTTAKFVNLDMEEYRDLRLTVETFIHTLEKPEFHHFSAGIVLQSYLPDSYQIQQELTAWAQKRVANGKAPIKIRIVKGANLAMEKVEASLKGWPQAPYPTKYEVDANFKRMLLYGTQKEHCSAAHLGIASHNLFDIAFAMILIAQHQTAEYICFEMLEGMADHMRRVIQKLAGDILLYCPASTEEEFQNAMAYLIRRLDENTAPENFLRQLFDMQLNSPEWNEQKELFKASCEMIPLIGSSPRREQDRRQEPTKPHLADPFENEPDTDWSLPQNRLFAEEILKKYHHKTFEPIPITLGREEIFTEQKGKGTDPSSPQKTLYTYSLANSKEADQAVAIAKNAEKEWSATSLRARSKILADIAQQMRLHRGDLIGAMMADGGKTIPEADTEISEAIDFAEYYLRNANDVCSFLKDLRWKPKGTVLVTPPWNFPCSIPAGGILASLITGNCVIFKPAKEAVLVGSELVRLFFAAGVPAQVLQFIACEEEPIGSQLIKDPRINMVVLTGATSTAKLFLNLRPSIDLAAETGGKNAIIVSALSDRDLAVKDAVQSAFGHAGQKCSACSLLICESEVYHSPQFRAQLKDAVTSWKVGSQWDPATKVPPLIHAPHPTLLKGLTELEEGEEWLVKPKQDPQNPNFWSPGVKLGVRKKSFTHQHEFFGPLLAMMEAKDLKEAIEIANDTPYGLTTGLHSLDKREQDLWLEQIKAGNCYINRGITGAIVQRQPFGGFKASSFGRGAKAGGPNYLMQFMEPQQFALPTIPFKIELSKELKQLSAAIEPSQLALWNASLENYLFFLKYYFSEKHDNSHILGEDNQLFYKPYPLVILRVQPEDNLVDVLRVVAASAICGTELEISGERSPLMSNLAIADWLNEFPHVKVFKETEKRFIERIAKYPIKRIRFLSSPEASLKQELAQGGNVVIVAEPLANGRVELLHYLREISLSAAYHRYGNLGERELVTQTEEEGCCSASACSTGCCSG